MSYTHKSKNVIHTIYFYQLDKLSNSNDPTAALKWLYEAQHIPGLEVKHFEFDEQSNPYDTHTRQVAPGASWEEFLNTYNSLPIPEPLVQLPSTLISLRGTYNGQFVTVGYSFIQKEAFIMIRTYQPADTKMLEVKLHLV